MKNRDVFWYSFVSNRKNFKKTLVPILICIIMIVSIFSFYKTINNYLINGVMKSYDYNNYFVTYSSIYDEKGAINKLKSLPHIINAYSSNADHYNVSLNKIGTTSVNGSFILVANDELFSDNEFKNIICPKHFFPDDYIEDNKFTKKNEVIDSQNLIGKYFNISYYQYVDDYTSIEKKLDLKLKDVYINNSNLIDENICYTSSRLIYDIYNDSYKNIDLSNQKDAIIIKLDSPENVEKVTKELDKLGFDISSSFTLNNALFAFVKSICIAVSLISIIFVIATIINLNKRNLIDKEREFTILKSIGFNNKDLKKILYSEIIILIILCALVSLGLLLFINSIYLILTNIYPFILGKIIIKIDYTIYLIYIIIISFLLLFTCMLYQKKILKLDISKV